MFLGFLIGFISFYYHTTYLLLILLFIHIIGTLYTEKRFNVIKQGLKTLFSIWIAIWRSILVRLYEFILKRFVQRSPPRILTAQKVPQQYLYSYHVKPINNFELQSPLTLQTLPRPGIFNLNGTTSSLNSLLQSLASLNSFCTSLPRNVNLSNSTYDPIVPTFLDLMAQLRNDHHVSDHQRWNALVDTSSLVFKLNANQPGLLARHKTTDIGELFQSLINVLNNLLSKQTSICSTNVLEQVQNKKLTTFSLDYLNRIFLETEAELHNKITLDNLDAQASYIIQYVDLTWLMHHIQLGSIIKHTFSGQLLHAHCCVDCSHIRFRSEPFQILTLPVNKTNISLERLISQLPKIELTDSISCSYCSSQNHLAYERATQADRQETLFTKITSTLAPVLTVCPQTSSTSTPPTTTIPSINTHQHSKMKVQTMIGNLPDVLCIQLKRFSYDRLSKSTTKLTTQIFLEPDKILDLSKVHYTTWLGLTNLSGTIPSRYRLIAVCLHLSKNVSSSSTNEHYVCLYRTEQSRWFLSDDERITEINQIDHVFQTPYITENCYLLFYERYL
ncbi:unnamed protein product [Adineta ricciae]|uniref:ubiquitinyl hydrolase 1 n=1 Tax=Adineta ricciae TaxID=249248 RepID=A0A815HZ23_ADIRI|nr:unnamed protein product [Adineta ricciae]